MLSPSASAQASSPMNPRPIRKAWAIPSGLGCTAWRNASPHWLPSPRSSRKSRFVPRRRYHQYVTNASQHQNAQRVVNHRLVVDGQELLAHRTCNGVEPRAFASCEDDPPHPALLHDWPQVSLMHALAGRQGLRCSVAAPNVGQAPRRTKRTGRCNARYIARGSMDVRDDGQGKGSSSRRMARYAAGIRVSHVNHVSTSGKMTGAVSTGPVDLLRPGSV